MNIVITGGTGFVDQAVAELYIKAGHHVFVTGHEAPVPGADYLGRDFKAIDWSALPALDILNHQAAVTDPQHPDPDETFRVNFRQTLDLFHQAAGHGVRRIVYASSAAVYGDTRAPFHEVGPFNPLTAYGLAKLALDRMTDTLPSGVSVIGLRYSNVYGPGESHKGRLASMVRQVGLQMMKGQRPKLYRHGEQRRDFVHVDDVARANVLAEHAAAAVPGALVEAAVKTTALAGAARASAPAVALAEGVLKAMFVGRLKVAVALVLAVGTLVFGAALGAHQLRAERPENESARVEPPAAPREKEKPAAKPEPARPADGKRMTVAGRVLDPEGKPKAGVRVAVCARQSLLLVSTGWLSVLRNDVLGETKTDPDGKYCLAVPRTDPQMTWRSVSVVAVGKGNGLVWRALDPDAESAEAELRLTAVRRINGHIVGLQGEDAAGVTLRVAKITRKAAPGEWGGEVTLRPPEGLPLTATTDARGNFEFHDLGPGLKVELEILDPRYERKDEWFIDTAQKKQCENIRLLLAPGRYVEGRVVYQDTGKGVPHARLMIANPIIEARADAEGRFKVPLYAPKESEPFSTRPRDVRVNAYAPAGEPYVGASKDVDFPKGVVKRTVELALPRAALMHGKVTEAGSGKPVAGAYIAYNADFQNAVASAADGSYKIAVPGGGLLTVAHPSGEFIPQILGSGGGGLNNPAGGSVEKPYGDPSYYHAIVKFALKKGEKDGEINLTLRRGVTVKGHLLGPDGKPTAKAVLFVGGHHRPRFQSTMHPLHVRDGCFEVRGLDPEKTYRLLFLERPRFPGAMWTVEAIEGFGQLWLRELLGPENKPGASVEVSPGKVKDELVVKLAPCGRAKVRFVDGDGKPLANYSPWLQLVVTPGPRIYQALQEKTLAAEVVTLMGRYGKLDSNDLATDARGYLTFEGLIPGATYRLKKPRQEPSNDIIKEFTVEAGKTLELEVAVK